MKLRSLSRLPSWLPTALIALAVYLGVLISHESGAMSPYWYGVIEMAIITAILSLGLNLIYGFNGQFSLGHVGFYAIGAYSSALISKDYVANWSGGRVEALAWIIAGQLGALTTLYVMSKLRIGQVRARLSSQLASRVKNHEAAVLLGILTLVLFAVAIAAGVVVAWGLHLGLVPVLRTILLSIPEGIAKHVVLFLALVTGASLAALVAYVVGLPLLRLSSDYFGIATLGFAIMVYTALQNSDLLIETMKGARGMVSIPRWSTWTWTFGTLVVIVAVMRNLIHSSHGRAVVSVREDEIAARTMGIDVAQVKTLAFAMGAFFAGLAGGLYAHLYGFLHPSNFSFVKGFDPLIIVVFGGLGSMTGTLLASGVFTLLIEGLRIVLPQGFEDWRFVIYPVFLLLIMLLRQEGLLGTREWGWLRAPIPPERDVAVPAGGVMSGVSGSPGGRA